MIAQFTIFPIGTKTDSLSLHLTGIMKLVVRSGLDYKVGPMGTTVEGEWDEIVDLIDRCRRTLLKKHSRLHIAITIDDRRGARGRITGKVNSLEKKTGLRLKK